MFANIEQFLPVFKLHTHAVNSLMMWSYPAWIKKKKKMEDMNYDETNLSVGTWDALMPKASSLNQCQPQNTNSERMIDWWRNWTWILWSRVMLQDDHQHVCSSMWPTSYRCPECPRRDSFITGWEICCAIIYLAARGMIWDDFLKTLLLSFPALAASSDGHYTWCTKELITSECFLHKYISIGHAINFGHVKYIWDLCSWFLYHFFKMSFCQRYVG